MADKIFHNVWKPFAGGISSDPHPTNLTVSGGATPSRTSEWLDVEGWAEKVIAFQITGSDASPDFTITADLSSQSAYDLNNKTAATTDYVAATVVSGATSGLYTRKDVHVFTVARSSNSAPMADNQTVGVSEEGSVLVVLTGSDSDGDTLGFGISGSPAHGVLSGFGPGAVAGTYEVRYTPEANFTGSDSFTFQVDDGKTGVATGTVSLNVAPVNDQPTLAAVANPTVTEGQALSFFLSGADIDAGDTLVYSLVSGPAGAAVDAASGEFTWTAIDGVASHPVTVRVTDSAVGNPLAAERSFTINVSDQAPALSISGQDTIEVGKLYTSFTDWHAHDKVALKDYLDLGGAGEPDWRKQE